MLRYLRSWREMLATKFFLSSIFRSHFGSSAAPSLSGQRGACEPLAEDYPQVDTSSLPPLRPIFVVRINYAFVPINLCTNPRCD